MQLLCDADDVTWVTKVLCHFSLFVLLKALNLTWCVINCRGKSAPSGLDLKENLQNRYNRLLLNALYHRCENPPLVITTAEMEYIAEQVTLLQCHFVGVIDLIKDLLTRPIVGENTNLNDLFDLGLLDIDLLAPKDDDTPLIQEQDKRERELVKAYKLTNQLSDKLERVTQQRMSIYKATQCDIEAIKEYTILAELTHFTIVHGQIALLKLCQNEATSDLIPNMKHRFNRIIELSPHWSGNFNRTEIEQIKGQLVSFINHFDRYVTKARDEQSMIECRNLMNEL